MKAVVLTRDRGRYTRRDLDEEGRASSVVRIRIIQGTSFSFGFCLSLGYTPGDQYRNKGGWALGVPLVVKSALKLRPCSQR